MRKRLVRLISEDDDSSSILLNLLIYDIKITLMNTLDAASSREMLLIYVAKGLRCFCMGIICVIFF